MTQAYPTTPTTARPDPTPELRRHERSGGGFGKIAGALAIGAVAGFAASHARKLAFQAPSIAAGDWAEGLKAEHRAVEKLFDALLATTEEERLKRDTLLAQIAYALNKHAVEEENVIYPAIKRSSADGRAGELFDDHAQVKTFIFELKEMDAADPQWIVRARDFRDLVDRHIREEEDEVFPALMAALPKEENDRLTKLMNWEGFKVA